MDKEYIPAIILYVLSALTLVVALICLAIDHSSWATWMLGGVVIMLVASSKLVKIGKMLREREEENKEKRGLNSSPLNLLLKENRLWYRG